MAEWADDVNAELAAISGGTATAADALLQLARSPRVHNPLPSAPALGNDGADTADARLQRAQSPMVVSSSMCLRPAPENDGADIATQDDTYIESPPIVPVTDPEAEYPQLPPGPCRCDSVVTYNTPPHLLDAYKGLRRLSAAPKFPPSPLEYEPTSIKWPAAISTHASNPTSSGVSRLTSFDGAVEQRGESRLSTDDSKSVSGNPLPVISPDFFAQSTEAAEHESQPEHNPSDDPLLAESGPQANATVEEPRPVTDHKSQAEHNLAKEPLPVESEPAAQTSAEEPALEIDDTSQAEHIPTDGYFPAQSEPPAEASVEEPDSDSEQKSRDAEQVLADDSFPGESEPSAQAPVENTGGHPVRSAPIVSLPGTTSAGTQEIDVADDSSTAETESSTSTTASDIWVKEIHSSAEFCSTEVMQIRERLRGVLDNHADAIRNRWLKKKTAQRKAIHLEAWPEIPLNYRPDFEPFLRGSSLENEKGIEKLFPSCRWPHINVEDLFRGRTLMVLLDSRSREWPSTFARSDLDAAHAGLERQV